MSEHVHHWMVEPANGPTSRGVCDCGEVRDFRNSLPIDHATKQDAYRLTMSVAELGRRRRESWGNQGGG